MQSEAYSPPFCTYDFTKSSALDSSTSSISSRRSSSSALIFSPCSEVAGASSTTSCSSRAGVDFFFISRSAMPLHLVCSLAQSVQQLSARRAFRHQPTHMGLCSTCRVHHRNPPQRVAADVEHHRVPVGRDDLRRPP